MYDRVSTNIQTLVEITVFPSLSRPTLGIDIKSFIFTLIVEEISKSI